MTAIRTDLDQKGEMWEPEIEPGLLRNKEKDSRPLTGQGRREENDPLYAGGGAKKENWQIWVEIYVGPF